MRIHELYVIGMGIMITYRYLNSDAARDLAGWHWNFPLICCDKQWWSSFTVTPEYIHSFRADQIAEYFFGTPCLQISGSKVSERGCNDILADYFGLGQTFIHVDSATSETGHTSPVTWDYGSGSIDNNLLNLV